VRGNDGLRKSGQPGEGGKNEGAGGGAR